MYTFLLYPKALFGMYIYMYIRILKDDSLFHLFLFGFFFQIFWDSED